VAIAEFPLPVLNSANPTPTVWYQMPEEFQVDFTEYDDGGRDVKLQNGGNGIKRWVLQYKPITETHAGLLDAHMRLAKLNGDGLSANSFNYRDRDGTLYSNVRYERYERPAHVKTRIQTRNITLVKYP